MGDSSPTTVRDTDGPDDSARPVPVSEPEVPFTLVEIIPGVAAVLGEAPEELKLDSMDLIPGYDREQLAVALGSVVNAGGVVGKAAEAIHGVQGLFRLDAASMALLKDGAELAIKDGAKLGSIFKGGGIVAQARWIPVSVSAASLATAVGPALSMIAMQMQLSEIAGLARTNIALTTQTLMTLRHEQWSELEGMAEAVDAAFDEAQQIGAVTDSVWEPIAPSRATIQKHLRLYRKKVAAHIRELAGKDRRRRREYLEANAEAMVFDTHALLRAVRTYAQYQSARAVLARTRGRHNEDDAKLFERIIETAPRDIELAMQEIGQLTDGLVRELRIIAELPGRATLPLTSGRRDTKAARLTCEQLLEVIEPLTTTLQPVAQNIAPEVTCAPEGLDVDPYLGVLRWFLAHDERVRGLAFVCEQDSVGFGGALAARRIDSSWAALSAKLGSLVGQALAPSTLVVVTNRRIVTASPSKLLRDGELGTVHQLADVRHVRSRADHVDVVRPTVGIATTSQDLRWVFPDVADTDDIDRLAAIVAEGSPEAAVPSALGEPDDSEVMPDIQSEE